MWNRRVLISMLCIYTIAVTPVLAVGSPCRCSAKSSDQQSCCHSSTEQAKSHASLSPSCCAKKPAYPLSAKRCCGCCVDAAPPYVPATSHQTTMDPTWTLVAVLPTTGVPRVEQELSDTLVPVPISRSGPPLLALYCRWLN